MTTTTLPSGVAIGFTGAFGSGCTTAAKHLRDARGTRYVPLSQAIKDQWALGNPGRTPTREDLQRLGDRMREQDGPGALVKAALKDVDADTPIAVDGIRNLGEVDELQSHFGYRFTLIAVMATAEERWSRIGQQYTDNGRSEADFLRDDERDRNEETPSGQQVELCVDGSDVLIDNGSTVDIGSFKKKIVEYTDLVVGRSPRYPNQTEILMNIAFGASHSSKCLKRHVGAIVVDVGGQVVGVGYNENPIGTLPCAEEPEYERQCYRDIVRNKHFEDLATRGARCPNCGEPLAAAVGPPWRCAACLARNPPVKTNLETFFFPDRAMSWCTAVHAEVWALLSAGFRGRGGTIYTTTFPCFQCAEKIIQSGIKGVTYTEAYPDVKGEARLKLAGVALSRFEGVRSSSFHRIFAAMKP